jgi:hypothetical protein
MADLEVEACPPERLAEAVDGRIGLSDVTDQPQDVFPRGRRLVAAIAAAGNGLLSLTEFVATPIPVRAG